MGVSITEGNSGGSLDMDLVLKGGQAFLDRLAQLKAAKDAADESMANLGCAQNVVALRDEAARRLDEAKNEATKISDEALQRAAAAQKAANEWISQTKDQTMADRLAAAEMKAEAEKMHADAKAALAEANRKHDAADAKLTSINAKEQAFAAAAAVLGRVGT
jgi:uncharacterized coiled-coil DUF342 family protein